MIRLCLLRHCTTAWNLQHRIQGRTDVPLTPEAEQQLNKIQLPAAAAKWQWYASPLLRAKQTAALISNIEPSIAELLVEMNWGSFEGLKLEEIEKRIEETGLSPPNGPDFCPPNGESPRMVGERLEAWCKQLVMTDSDTVVAVTHKGVIHAALYLVTEWDMLTRFSPKIDWRLPVCFTVDPDGRLQLDRVNVPLDEI